VKTEVGPSRSVIPGAYHVAVERPEASTVKFGMSPACGPCGLSRPVLLLPGIEVAVPPM
jgi:hypothetical protein